MGGLLRFGQGMNMMITRSAVASRETIATATEMKM